MARGFLRWAHIAFQKDFSQLLQMCKHVRALQICNRFLRVPVTLEDIENGGVCEILKQLIVLGRINLAFGVAKIVSSLILMFPVSETHPLLARDRYDLACHDDHS
jgi:hypothetical protein